MKLKKKPLKLSYVTVTVSSFIELLDLLEPPNPNLLLPNLVNNTFILLQYCTLCQRLKIMPVLCTK